MNVERNRSEIESKPVHLRTGFSLFGVGYETVRHKLHRTDLDVRLYNIYIYILYKHIGVYICLYVISKQKNQKIILIVVYIFDKCY